MEAIVSDIQSQSAEGIGGLEQLNASLTTMREQLKQVASAQGLLQAAASLETSVHSLGLLHLLSVQAEVVGDVEDERAALFSAVGQLLLGGDAAQLQMAPRLLVDLCKKYTELASMLRVPLKGIAPLQAAAGKLCDDPSGDSSMADGRALTPMDCDVLQLCLLGQHYSSARRHIEALDVYGVDPVRTLLTALDHVKYWYYGGMVWAGLKDWGRAVASFKIAVTAPASAVSAVVVEAYKKMVLCCLLKSGTKPLLPSYTAGCVVRHLKQSQGVRGYDALAAKFQEDDLNALNLEVETKDFHAQLVKDKNLGLARQAVHALTERRILKLTTCFVAVSLEDIAKQVGLDGGASEAEALVVRMVARKLVNASIDASSGMVRFSDAAVGLEGSAGNLTILSELRVATESVVDLTARVEALDIALSKSPAILKLGLGRVGSAVHGGGYGGHPSDEYPEEIAMAEDFANYGGKSNLI